MSRIVSYNCNSVRNNVRTIIILTQDYDIILLQEIMLLKEDLNILKTINESFDVIACVEDKSNEGIMEGRPSKGVAILWKSSLSKYINSLYCNERIIGIIVTSGDLHILIVNVYLPCDKQDIDSLHEFRSSIATLNNYLAEQQYNHVIVGGDFNASPNKGRFWKDIVDLFNSKYIKFIDVEALQDSSFTYLCPAKNTTSWLDHIAVSESMKDIVGDFKIRYDLALFDHVPLACKLNIDICDVDEKIEHIDPGEFVDWQKFLCANNVQLYESNIDNCLNELNLETFDCLDCDIYRCCNEQHIKELNTIYNSIISLLLKSSFMFKKEPKRKH